MIIKYECSLDVQTPHFLQTLMEHALSRLGQAAGFLHCTALQSEEHNHATLTFKVWLAKGIRLRTVTFRVYVRPCTLTSVQRCACL